MIKKTGEVWVDSGQMSVVSCFGCGDVEGTLRLASKAGEVYTAFVEIKDHGNWGLRVIQISVLRGDVPSLDGMIRVGTFVCESEALVVSDPCYIFDDEYGSGGFYDNACNATFNREDETRTENSSGLFESSLGTGICCSSGLGDGCYESLSEIGDDGIVDSINIVFIEEDEDEEGEDEDDEAGWDA